MAKINPIQLQKYLKGANYPMSRANLIALAQKNGADDKIIEVLRQIADKTYASPVGITQEIGKLE